MAGFRFTSDTITPAIEAAKRRAFNMKPALDFFGGKMLLSIDENFRAEGRRQGTRGAWEPLSPITIAMRPAARKGSKGRPKPLILTGFLRTHTIHESTRKTLAVGSVVKYANDHHQDGVWGTFIMKKLTRVVPAHEREVWVKPKKAKALRKARRQERAEKRAAAAEARGATGTRVKRKAMRDADRTAKRKGAGKGRPKRRKRPKRVPPRPGLVLAKVKVKEHKIDRTIRVPSRPIYLFQPADLRNWNRIQLNWVVKGTLSGAA